jgi:hypothetical protein
MMGMIIWLALLLSGIAFWATIISLVGWWPLIIVATYLGGIGLLSSSELTRPLANKMLIPIKIKNPTSHNPRR